ncbi:hypothetical protein WR25_05522 [Diploscapter pachys]|uniref:EF-hand domain-containing protein n=1 Tax=Diploscapter pachys TaxID=2018661 RepID=A0A2A2L9Z4_9BILA|nr:hypothetical protein WR25_05522 [Diploscapter pachys]
MSSFRFDRVLHQVYSEPERFTGRSCIDRILVRIYWGLRAAQFKIFYKNEELDVDDSTDKWEIGVQPPLLETLVQQTHFDPRWIKYMYSRFKNVCPTGRMREHEFRKVLSSIIAAEKATDQYITRLFVAFSQQDKQTLTFEAFLSFTQSVFSLNEGKGKKEDVNRETVYQRATTIFNDLDRDQDGLVTVSDMEYFFAVGNDNVKQVDLDEAVGRQIEWNRVVQNKLKSKTECLPRQKSAAFESNFQIK